MSFESKLSIDRFELISVHVKAFDGDVCNLVVYVPDKNGFMPSKSSVGKSPIPIPIPRI